MFFGYHLIRVPAVPKRVLILGGGFAGVTTAQQLARDLRRAGRLGGTRRAAMRGGADDAIEIILVNRDNYFVFQPLMADIIPGTIETTHVGGVLLRRMLRGVQVEVGLVDHIDVVARRGPRSPPARRPPVHALVYDALIVALGSVTDFSVCRGDGRRFALGFKNLGRRLLSAQSGPRRPLEEARVEPDSERREPGC